MAKKTYKKIDDETVEITTTPDAIIEEIGRELLQTELDHIPDRRVKIQEQMNIVDARETELIAILKVFD